jgi:uncharacterized membrane protein required for colicin V production
LIPIEVFLACGMIAFGMVGLSRGLSRELGATAGFIAMILVLVLVGGRVGPIAARGLHIAGFDVTQDLAAWVAITAVIFGTVLAVYHGDTLTIHALPSPGPAGKILDLGAGLLNGWLVLGTWWYATHNLGYPMSKIGLYQGEISDRALNMIDFTPLAVLPDERALVYVSVALVSLIGLKVVR